MLGEENTVKSGKGFMDTYGGHSDMLQFVTFNLATQRYATDILKVQEINNLKDITPIPKSPRYVEGAINLRGKVIPVLNLRKKFNMPFEPLNDLTKIIIIVIHGITMGIIVDSVSDVLRISRDVVEPPPRVASGNIRSEFIRGIAKLQEGLIIILDMDNLLDIHEQQAVFGDA